MNSYFETLSKTPIRWKKMKVRDFLFNKFEGSTNIVGLAGPNINMYIRWCKSRKFNNITIYENNKGVLLYQLSKVKKTKGLEIKLDNINNCIPNKENTLYDLDYCCGVDSVSKEIRRFDNNFIITLSRRQGNDTIDKFFKKRREKIISKKDNTSPIHHTVYKTNTGEYIYAPYFDTSPMCSIAKIK